MDQPADVADTLWRGMLDTPYSHAKKTAPRQLAPGTDAGVSLLRCPPPDAYMIQEDGTWRKKRSPSDDGNARPKRKRDDEERSAATIPQSPTQPTRDIRRFIGNFDDIIPAICSKMDELSSRMYCIKQAKKFLDSLVAKKVLDMFNSLTGQCEEYRAAVQDIEASLDTINGVVAFALCKVMVDIQKEADGVLGGDQEQPVIVADDDNHPDADNAESAVRPDNTPDHNADVIH